MSPLTWRWLTPGFDISPFTGCLLWTQANGNYGRRGVLYISDLLRNGPFEKGNTSGFDWSPGDFRLSPFVANATFGPTALANAPGGLQGGPNPLVDRGFFPNSLTHPLPVTMLNGQSMTTRPGSLSVNGTTYLHDSWREDCEGFGNRRVWTHGLTAPANYRGPIDIGADELGSLPIAGQRFGSTSFLSFPVAQLPSGVSPSTGIDNKYAWILGPKSHPSYPSGTFASPALPPRFRKANATTPPQGQESWFADWKFQPMNYAYYIPPPTRITPHLLPDIHPHWQTYFGYPSNPIWQGGPATPPATGACWPQYNPSLFLEPDFGVINPPGTYPIAGPHFAWLDGLVTTAQPTLAYIGLNSGSAVVSGPGIYTSFDDWCVGKQVTQQGTVKQKYTFRSTRRQPGGVGTKYFDVVRYSVENAILAPPYGSALSSRNVQSFEVAVYGALITK